MTGAVDSLTSPAAEVAATDAPSSHPQFSVMGAKALVDSQIAPAVEVEAATLPPRLIDSDPSKYRSLKQVIVLGSPGSGTDGVGDALKKLGYKVYDSKAATDRYERDFPLWLEAARLRLTERSYNKSDYDKLIGDHNALVGAPTIFFDREFVKLYPNVKVILVTRKPDETLIRKILEKVETRFWQFIDPVFYGNIAGFLLFNGKADDYRCYVDQRFAREAIRERNLLEIHNLIAWVPLCQFLGVPIPAEPAPELHDNTIKAVFAARPKRMFMEKASKALQLVVMVLNHTSILALVALIAALAAFPETPNLLTSSKMSFRLFDFLMVQSQIRDITRLSAVGAASSTLICGFVVGYTIASFHNSRAASVTSSACEHRHRTNNGRRKGKQARGRQSENDENTRPERPTLPTWSGVQEHIRKNDAEMQKAGMATFQERKDKHVTFHVTHKRTESSPDLSSGPRKIASVEETVQ